MGVQRHAPAALTPGNIQYPLYRRLGGHQDLSGSVRKNSPPTGFDPRTFQRVASRYTNCVFTVPLLYTSGMLNDAHWKQYTDISKYRTAWISVLFSWLTHVIRSALRVRAHIILYKLTVSMSAGGQYDCLCIPTLTFWSLLVCWCTTSLTFNNCTLCPHCIYVFCIYLRTNSDLCHLLHKPIGFYNRDEKCLRTGALNVAVWALCLKGYTSVIL